MRLFLIGLSVGLLALLLIACRLEPNSTGMGTHHQLGLPPCSIRLLFGLRCPACGMTTSWAYFVRGDVVAAMQSNVGGTLLALLAAITVPVAAWKSFRGGPLTNASIWALAVILSSIVILTTIEWLVRIL